MEPKLLGLLRRAKGAKNGAMYEIHNGWRPLLSGSVRYLLRVVRRSAEYENGIYYASSLRGVPPRAPLSKFEITLANFEMQIVGWWGSRLRFLRL